MFQTRQKFATGLFIVSQALLISACATTEGTEPTFEIPRPSYSQAPAPAPRNATVQPAAQPPTLSEGSLMRHTLRQVTEFDAYKMGKLVDHELSNLKDLDDDAYLNQVAVTLGQTVFLQPHFTERESALKELKAKVDQEEYLLCLDKAATDLLTIVHSSSTASDQAGAFEALTNLVTEVRTLRRPELRTILQKIADAHLTISDDAKRYAQDTLQKIVSPSAEAQSALKTM